MGHRRRALSNKRNSGQDLRNVTTSRNGSVAAQRPPARSEQGNHERTPARPYPASVSLAEPRPNLNNLVTITKNSGTKMTPSTVPEIVPPRTPDPIALRPPDPAPELSTSGRTPSENAIEVMMIGRKRCLAASTTASMTRSPATCLSRANSTIRIAFLPVRPITVSSPT